MRTFTPCYVTDHVVVTVHCCEDVQTEEEQEGECPLCKKKYSFLIDEEGHIKVKEHRQRSKNEQTCAICCINPSTHFTNMQTIERFHLKRYSI